MPRTNMRKDGMANMNSNRREFIQMSALCAGAALTGCVSGRAPSGPLAKDGDYRAILLHLGQNMWCDWYPKDADVSALKDGLPDRKLRCRDDIWRQATDYAADRGLNMVVVDVGEGLAYPRRPELAVEGSWSAEKLSGEVARLRSRGLEVVPKLNFSTLHNGWMKHYRRMITTDEYYRVCEDVIRDVHEAFGSPRYVHIGCNDEFRMHPHPYQYFVSREGNLYKHDFLHLVKAVEGLGARPWAWCDYGWTHPEFWAWCPKGVLLSNRLGDAMRAGFELRSDKMLDTSKAVKIGDDKRIPAFRQLDEAGFDQVPCGTADMGQVVRLGREAASPARLKGFLVAPWAACDSSESLAAIKRGVDQLVAVA